MAKPQWRLSIAIAENRRWTASRRLVCQEPNALRAIERALRSFKVHPRRITGISVNARAASSLVLLVVLALAGCVTYTFSTPPNQTCDFEQRNIAGGFGGVVHTVTCRDTK
jgi:hypothetical protein